MKGKNDYKIQWLNRYKKSKYTLAEIEADMEEFRLSFTLPKSQQITDMPTGSGRTGGLEENMVILEKHQEKLQNQLANCYKIRKEIKEAIDAIECADAEKYRLLLTLKYIRCCNWSEIAEKMSYSIDYVKGYLHGRSLEFLNIDTR